MPDDATSELDADRILENARQLGPMIEASASAIDRDRRLPDDLVEAMRRAGIFRIAFPRSWGGPEMPILDQARLVETLAYHDASTAWVAMICSDSGHYAARVEESVARELYPQMDLLTSGLLYPVGQARRVDGGFRVTGRWQFGSGCLHADRIVGGCLVFDGDAPVIDADGLPETMVVWLERDDVEIHDTWETTGLAGSGSNDYSVTDAFVPDGRHFHPFRIGARTEALYRYHGLFFANLPAVSIGCARRMVDDLIDLATTKVSMPSFVPMKDEYRVQIGLADAVATLTAATAYHDQALTSLWSALEAGRDPSPSERAALGLMTVHVVHAAHEIAESICELVGAQAIYRSSPFERRRRDLATIAAHVVAQPKTAATIARLLFGDEPPFLVV